MGEAMSDQQPQAQQQEKPAQDVILTPSQIAEMTEAAAAAREAVGNTMQNVGEGRSGQLSPPHTPGHTVNRR
jgi:hypothetical protein